MRACGARPVRHCAACLGQHVPDRVIREGLRAVCGTRRLREAVKVIIGKGLRPGVNSISNTADIPIGIKGVAQILQLGRAVRFFGEDVFQAERVGVIRIIRRDVVTVLKSRDLA